VDAVAMPHKTTFTPSTLLAGNLVRIWPECTSQLELCIFLTSIVLTHGQLCNQVSDEERGRNVGELIPFQLQVFLHPHCTGVVVGDFVNEIHEVAEKGKRTDAPVSFAPQPAKRDIVAVIGGGLCHQPTLKRPFSWLRVYLSTMHLV
jgi:hypothetical protein